MIIFPNRLCLHFADSLDRAKLLRRRACKIGDRFKMRQQRTAACCADAGDILQRRVHTRLLAQIAVMGDAEAVGFIADALNEMQRGRLAVEQNALLLIRQEDFFQLLCQAEHRNVVTRLEHRFPRKPQLLRPAVNQNQIGQIGKAGKPLSVRRQFSFLRKRFALLRRPRQAAGDDLIHGRKIVCAFDGLDTEDAVFFLRRFAVDGDDHTRHAQHALRIGDIISLDAARRMIHADRFGKCLACADGALMGAGKVRIALGKRVLRVLQRKLDELMLRSPLRFNQRDLAALSFRKCLRDILRLFRQSHAENFGRRLSA